MQQLSIVPRLLPAVRRGEKTHTLRWQEGDIHPGPLRYCNQQNPADTLVVWVTSVETLPLCGSGEIRKAGRVAGCGAAGRDARTLSGN
ncbi:MULTISPECIES: ASCH domain-containing protein [Pantoea]|uniref:ASCH domain-containing protein n=1 Tax=Pantoea brenneri TaxID=472694 RepID=A0ABU9MLQ3_9GAMM|nr:ASCH domain-containing protein [Pantoea sp. 3.5.1]